MTDDRDPPYAPRTPDSQALAAALEEQAREDAARVAEVNRAARHRQDVAQDRRDGVR